MCKVANFVIAVVASLTLAPTNSTHAQQPLKEQIVGTWKIISWETVGPDGQVVNIWMRPHPTGLGREDSNLRMVESKSATRRFGSGGRSS